MNISVELRTRGTLKAFKAAFRPGLQIRVADHWHERYRGCVRTVTKVQRKGYWFTQEGLDKRQWGLFPKASQLSFDGKLARIVLDEKRSWTLDLSGAA